MKSAPVIQEATIYGTSPFTSNVVKNLDIQIERRPVNRVIPNDANPRAHSPAQVAQIAASIREFGFVNPILVAADGRLIAGEARFRAAQSQGMREVPVIVLAHLSEVQRRALVIADNQLALNAGWDEEMLREQLAALKDADFNLDILGFPRPGIGPATSRAGSGRGAH